jgi:hypothetical protein
MRPLDNAMVNMKNVSPYQETLVVTQTVRARQERGGVSASYKAVLY